MRNVLAGFLVAAALRLVYGNAALADADPTVHQIYEAASGGHLDQAQQMMDQVLRDHPNSEKAHYVQAELYAREGKLALARVEVARAQQLAPGLPNENPRSVAALKSELGLIRPDERAMGIKGRAPSASHFPWGAVLILALVAGIIWMLFRGRRTSALYPQNGVPATAAGTYGAGGYGLGVPVAGGGIGSTVAGGLAGGLAAGAGLVAGEAFAHRFLDGERTSEGGAFVPDDSEWNPANRGMGGSDFGVDDASSWDNGSSGGGDDWT